MSSTTGIQTLLVNTFRPVYTYDPTSTLYIVKLDLSNVNTYYGNNANVLWAQVGDSACNVYVGKEAGNDPTITVKACSNVTAVGYAAASNASNVSNSAFVGKEAGTGAQSMTNMVGIGYQAGVGTASVRVGAGTTGVGISNVVVGSGSTTGAYSNCVLLGPGLTADKSWRFQIGSALSPPFLIGDISSGWVGIGRSTPISIYTKLDVGGDVYVSNSLGVNTTPGYRTLDVNGNFRSTDGASNILDVSGGNLSMKQGSDTLDFSNGLTWCPKGFVSIQSNIEVPALGSATIGTIRRGMINISAIDQASSSRRAAYVFFAYTTSNLVALASNVPGVTTITTDTTNIRITTTENEVRTYDYSITYFPLP